jgi:FAD/FMN-containing dehydrogenase
MRFHPSHTELFQCTFLGAVLWGKVHFPVSSVYKAQQGLLWSQQVRDVTPVCRVAPTNALDVSTALLILRTTGCQFAVKGGGHTPFVGANTIEKGVTIDLINLSDVKLVKNNAELQVGGGAKWGQVYPVLDSKNLRVIGGRASDVGVGGLTTGGGISFFSARYGFACDNVNTFQVVFADGTIREVTKDRYPDVYWALRGGSNNFGIVTRFDLQTYPGGNMWGESPIHEINLSNILMG